MALQSNRICSHNNGITTKPYLIYHISICKHCSNQQNAKSFAAITPILSVVWTSLIPSRPIYVSASEIPLPSNDGNALWTGRVARIVFSLMPFRTWSWLEYLLIIWSAQYLITDLSLLHQKWISSNYVSFWVYWSWLSRSFVLHTFRDSILDV